MKSIRGRFSFSERFIILVDLFLALVIFFLVRLIPPGDYPRWYWLVLTAICWVVIGIATRKLRFAEFKKTRHAFATIVIVDLLSYLFIYLLWLIFPMGKDVLLGQLLPLPFLIGLELAFCMMYRGYVRHNIPVLFEENVPAPDCERNIGCGVKLEESPLKVNYSLYSVNDVIKNNSWTYVRNWLEDNRDSFSEGTLISESFDDMLEGVDNVTDIICLAPFNDCRHINSFLQRANSKLPVGGSVSLHGETSDIHKAKLIKGAPQYVGWVIYCFYYIWHRVFPKLSLTRQLYMAVTGGHNRSVPRVEILGRISRAGFTIVNDQISYGEYYVSAVKTSEPISIEPPSYGPFIKLSRVSQGGKIIKVYKFRTMYAYSEYLQDYVYERLGLEPGGKIRDDFRVNVWGMFLRRSFIDEIPMVINWFRRDLKLVGVRPVSKSYLKCYTPQMRELRLSVKPGLVPPLYYDYPKPESLTEIHDSERRYIEEYKKHPFRTDWRYFWKILFNIFFRGVRSR